MKNQHDRKKVVYTCITNRYDELFNHAYIDDEWDYVCFTDGAITKDDKNSRWKILPLSFKNLDPTRNQKWHKLHPHILFPEYEVSIWIDANIDVLSNALFVDVNRVVAQGSVFSFAPHPERNCIYEELEACIYYKKDDPEVMNRQIELYQRLGYPKNQGLVDGSIIFRMHHEDDVVHSMNEWWDWIVHYSKRDQLSLNYVLWKNGLKNIPLNKITYRNDDGRVVYWPHNADTRAYLAHYKFSINNLTRELEAAKEDCKDKNANTQLLDEKNTRINTAPDTINSSVIYKICAKLVKIFNRIIK